MADWLLRVGMIVIGCAAIGAGCVFAVTAARDEELHIAGRILFPVAVVGGMVMVAGMIHMLLTLH